MFRDLHLLWQAGKVALAHAREQEIQDVPASVVAIRSKRYYLRGKTATHHITKYTFRWPEHLTNEHYANYLLWVSI